MRAAAVLLVFFLFAGCAAPPKPLPKYSERVVLLPNRDGRPSAVIVRRASGEHELASPYEAFELLGNKEELTAYTEEDVQQRYETLLEAQPPRALSLVLFFNTSTTELAARLKAVMDEVKEKVRAFPAGQVVVIGHTDRVGKLEANDALSLKRAAAVRDMLIRLGIAEEKIEEVGRGEREPLVHTGDGVAHESNRRVEIKLR